MTPELGNFALILGLCMSLVLAIFPLIGSLNNTPGWVALAKPAAWGQFFFVAISFAVLVNAFLSNDFSVLYVARNGNTQLSAAPCRRKSWRGCCR
jgi:cytochrome c-type biogenesis protein CcmF